VWQYQHARREAVAAFAVLCAQPLLASCGAAIAQEVNNLPPVNVVAPGNQQTPSQGPKPGDPLINPAASTNPNQTSTVTGEGVQILGGPAQASTYKPLDLMPSVIEDSADPYGLSFNRSITVRGVSDFFMSRTVDGLPIGGIVGGADFIDLSNIGSETLYRGSLESNQGLGFSNAAGVLDLHVLPPAAKFGGTLTEGFGSDGMWHTGGRIDSGLLPTGTSFFISGSVTDADKWKGYGDASRENLMVGVTQTFGSQLDASVYYAHNNQKANNYLGLSYAQAQNLSANYWLDYGRSPTNYNSANYYGFNATHYTDNVVWGEINYHITPDQTLTFKPYYWANDGYQLSGTAGAGAKKPGTVSLWPIDNNNLGAIAEYKIHFGWNGDLLLGFWAQQTKPEPPPLGKTAFTVTNTGALAWKGWSVLAKTDDHEFYSPYTQYTQTVGATTFTGGLRLHVEGTPWMQYYNTAGLPDVSYADIWSYNPTADTHAYAPSRTFYEWLPNIGVRQQLNNDWSASVAYSRKVARPDWGPEASQFTSNEAAFLKYGMNLQSLMNMLQPETVDEVDASVRYQSGGLTIEPMLFGFKTHNKEVLVFDPNVGQSYYQSNAATTGAGAELEASWIVNPQWTLVGSLTAQSERYDANIATGTGTVMNIKGKMVPYTPEYAAKLAATYTNDGFSITPVVRFIGTRYGLADNSQSVSPYAVADVTASYEFGTKLGLTPITFNCGVMNLFNAEYIGAISVNEDNLSSTSYYVAPPRTLFAGLTAKF
jgi:iron complex outermembrane receptor protein